MSLLSRVLREERARRKKEAETIRPIIENVYVWVDVEPADVRPGDRALRIDQELDARTVVSVDTVREMVTLDILGAETPPIPREFYTYRRLIPKGHDA